MNTDGTSGLIWIHSSTRRVPSIGSSCSVRVHVDVTGSGEVSAGDLVSTTHVGVTAADEDQVVEVPLQLLE